MLVFLKIVPPVLMQNRSVAEMEQRLDGLLALLSSATQGSKSPRKEAATVSSPLRLSDTTQFQSPPTVACAESFNTCTNPCISAHSHGYFPRNLVPFLVFDDIEDVISKGILGFQEAEESLRVFKTKVDTFPFIVVRCGTSLDFMRREKLFLLLTILAWGAQVQLSCKGP